MFTVQQTFENPKSQRQLTRDVICRATDLHSRAEKSQDVKLTVMKNNKGSGSLIGLGSIDKVKRCKSFVSTQQSTPPSPKMTSDPELDLMREIHKNLLIDAKQ